MQPERHRNKGEKQSRRKEGMREMDDITDGDTGKYEGTLLISRTCTRVYIFLSISDARGRATAALGCAKSKRSQTGRENGNVREQTRPENTGRSIRAYLASRAAILSGSYLFRRRARKGLP